MQVALADFGAVEVAEANRVAVHRGEIAPNLMDIPGAVRDALDKPRNFPPLRRALTPDDQVAIVVDDRLPQLGPIVATALSYLTEVGIDPGAITLIGAPGSTQPWIESLPDDFQNVRTEIHDPADRKAVAYLASTRKGRRVYLNRTLVDADQSIVIAGCRYDSTFGRFDGACALFPTLSNVETRADANRFLSMASPNGTAWPLHDEAAEIAWLLGVPFMLHLIEGEGDGVSHLVGGTVDSVPECRQLLNERWRLQVDRRGQIVIATLGGNSDRQDFEAISRAALCASRVVEPNGRIVILTRSHPNLGESAELLRGTDSPAVAARRIQERQPPDRVAALQWLEAARHATLYLLSGLPEESVEEMFATPLQQARQVQRLVDAGGSTLLLEEADKMLADF